MPNNTPAVTGRTVHKARSLSRRRVDLDADIALINQFSPRQLTPDDVYAFPLVLCDNEVDRDIEKFNEPALIKLAALFEGKTGIFNHSWNAKDQVARIYKTEIVSPAEKNSLGEPLKQLWAYAYILKTDAMKDVIDKIEGGILKEVSIGFKDGGVTCSICGKPMRWMECEVECEDGHCKGMKYKEGLCYGQINEPSDAYEFSFVAVPAQRGAGVQKDFENTEQLVQAFLRLDLSANPDSAHLVYEHCLKAMQGAEETARRQEIFADNINFLKRGD